MGVLVVVCLGLAGWNIWQKNSYQSRLDGLYNKLAEVAETVKVRDGEFKKMMERQKDIADAIDKSNEQGKGLSDDLKRTNSKLLSVTNAQVSIREEVISIKGILNKPRSDGSWEFPVEREQGLLGVGGLCYSGPDKDAKSGCELKLRVKPWTFSQVINQKEDGSWSVDASVPPEISLSFGRTAVNPYFFKPRWYERFNFSGQLLLNGREGLGVVGAGYKFSNFNISGLLGVGSAGNDHTYYGVGLTWFPWEK